jgi:hypothetical protein
MSEKKIVPSVLDHITDVGAGQFEGVDSTYRIRQQYQNVNVKNPFILSAGHSPLHVAFAGTTCLAEKSKENANWILNKIWNIKQKKRLPIALNSAPRNSDKKSEDGKEDSIFWVKVKGHYADYVVYGLQVVEFVKVFHNIEFIKRVVSVNEIIEDTSKGSQFRSAEHLPLVHILLAMGELEEHSTLEEININDIFDRYPKNNKAIVAPTDEYKNGRLIIEKSTLESILKSGKCIIPEICDVELIACSSLTKVEPGELSVWPSSNYFPDKNLAVLNIGTRWKPETTRVTDNDVINLSQKLLNNVGKNIEIKLK